MALSQSPSIVTNGLTFYKDLNNVKSFKGPAIQNLTKNLTPVGLGTSAGYVASSGNEKVDIPQLGLTDVNYVLIQNNYSAVSTNCCPSLYSYGNSVTVTPNTLYTYGIVYKCDSGYTSSNYMYRYEYNSSGAYVTEGGVHSTANRIHLGNGWYWAWGTFTTQATTVTLSGLAAFYYQYSTLIDKLSVAKIFLTQGNYTALHPRYWPDVNTTRTNTQAVTDLINNTAITANSLTYATDGTYSFNGTSDYISIAQPAIGLTPNNWTISGWIRPTSATESFFLTPQSAGVDHFLRYDGVNKRLGLQITEAGDVNNRAYYTALNSVPLNTWTNFSVSIKNLTIKAYINSVESLNQTEAIAIANWDGGWVVGQRGISSFWYTGQISSLQVYNRELSAAEVRQNFNALRGRYGV
jgi:hypothetical protein